MKVQRRKTREVMVGDVGVGGDNPIRIQSMTISDTLDTNATVAEVTALAEAGCEIVRITAPSIKEAENLRNIKQRLLARGITAPLVADIHFTPNAAMIAAEHVEKVRINPGNYADKKRFEQRDYTDAEYAAELARIEEKFTPLVLKCKALGRAMRIGANHGSLSDRIMNRFGDTADGMVESALEFVRICRKLDYHDLILSMKSSNAIVAIQAYRLLAARMDELRMDYPFHLGVTEAGDGAEGRIKSAVGIGGLLEDGVGDTIRVSLTEDAVAEIPVAARLARLYNVRNQRPARCAPAVDQKEREAPADFWQSVSYNRRATLACDMVWHVIGAGHPPPVELSLTTPLSDLEGAVAEVAGMTGRPQSGPLALAGASKPNEGAVAETVHVRAPEESALDDIFRLKSECRRLALDVPFAVHVRACEDFPERAAEVADRLVLEMPALPVPEQIEACLKWAAFHGKPVEWAFVMEAEPDASNSEFERLRDSVRRIVEVCDRLDYWQVVFSLTAGGASGTLVPAYRHLAFCLGNLRANLPILLRSSMTGDFEDSLLRTAAQLGVLLCDGIGDGLHLDGGSPCTRVLNLAYDILQATRVRISKTEYISCPSCGRTLFDLQTTTERIKSRTSHLKGVKIAIMGCIVNGPGEMADADFGYVGSGPGTVNLFVGKECVERNIPESQADDRLIQLIQDNGRWVSPAGVEDIALNSPH